MADVVNDWSWVPAHRREIEKPKSKKRGRPKGYTLHAQVCEVGREHVVYKTLRVYVVPSTGERRGRDSAGRLYRETKVGPLVTWVLAGAKGELT